MIRCSCISSSLGFVNSLIALPSRASCHEPDLASGDSFVQYQCRYEALRPCQHERRRRVLSFSPRLEDTIQTLPLEKRFHDQTTFLRVRGDDSACGVRIENTCAKHSGESGHD